jgi:transcriptional regulator with XRE-family HTH domain
MSALSEKIKELRKAKNMSQADLAKALGVKTGTISNYETGKTVPPKATLKKLSEVLGEELAAKEPEKPKMTVEEAAEKIKKKNPKIAKAADALKEKVEKEMAKASNPTVSVQSMMGGTITVEKILAKVKEAAPDAKQIYVKPEENKAYWVSKKSAGSVDLWD